jgi:hypothetical protein
MAGVYMAVCYVFSYRDVVSFHGGDLPYFLWLYVCLLLPIFLHLRGAESGFVQVLFGILSSKHPLWMVRVSEVQMKVYLSYVHCKLLLHQYIVIP